MSATVTTQAELDAAIAAREAVVYINSPDGVWLTLGDTGSSHVVALGSSHVVAWDSSHVGARGSSHVVARGSSHVVAWGSSHVVAWGSSHVEAWGSSHVEARGSSHVEAGGYVAVHLHSQMVTLNARGAVIDMTSVDLSDLATWCDLKGVHVQSGVMTLYKYVDADLRSHYGTEYPIGEQVTAEDWQPTAKCGNGLHVSESPSAAQGYAAATCAEPRWLAVSVRTEDAVVVDGNKVKCRTLRVLHEVDRYGREITR